MLRAGIHDQNRDNRINQSIHLVIPAEQPMRESSPLWSDSASRGLLGLVAVMAVMTVAAFVLPLPDHFIDRSSYAMLHLMMEICAIVIGVLVFGVNYHQLSTQQPGRMVMVACAMLGAAVLDLGHAMSFPGMPDLVTPAGAEKGIAFWLPARLFIAATLALVAFLPYGPLRTPWLRVGLLGFYLSVAGAIFGLVLFAPETLPDTYMPGTGLTDFKIRAEILITALFTIAALAFLWRAHRRQPGENMLMFAAAAISALGEALFTQYRVTNDVFNLMGHGYKVVAYLILYRAEFVLSLRAPYVELQRERENLAKANSRFQQIFDLTAVGMTQVEPVSGRILQVNRRFCTFLGYRPEELLGRWFGEFTFEEDRPSNLAMYDRLLRGEVPELTLEKRYRRKDGKLVWGFITSTLLRDDKGRPILGLTAIADITALREAEVERLQLQQQLQQSQKMEALGQLTGGIAHDFNNILATIMGYADLALERMVPDKSSKLAHYLREIGNASERARDLVAKLLAYSRTQVRPIATPLAVEPAIRQTIAMLHPTMPSGISLESRVQPGLTPVAIDIVDLQQVLMNLLINARDAIGEHGCIIIEARRYQPPELDGLPTELPPEPERIELLVKDTGHGIDEEMLPRIFDPFFTTKGVGKGSGLGLSVVQGIVRNVGGHISVRNRRTGGACFSVLLPAVPATADAPAAASPPPPSAHNPAAGSLSMADKTRQVIWIVEDKGSLANFLRELLEGSGYQVVVFSNARDALATFDIAADTVDLVLTDQTMPEMSGADLARAMLAIRPRLPIILATGYSDSIDAESARRLGIRRFLKKPMSAQALLAAVSEVLAMPSSDVPDLAAPEA
jgi:PAS domain S-box-containing protein